MFPNIAGDCVNNGTLAANLPGKESSELSQLRLLLEQLDAELERIVEMWARIEVVFGTVLLKGEHLATFIDYGSSARRHEPDQASLHTTHDVPLVHTTARNPRVMARFRDRLNQYNKFWVNMQRLASTNIGIIPTDGKPVNGTGGIHLGYMLPSAEPEDEPVSAAPPAASHHPRSNGDTKETAISPNSAKKRLLLLEAEQGAGPRRAGS